MIINKVDRKTSRVEEVESEIFDLFCDLNISDHILDYPVYYASSRVNYFILDALIYVLFFRKDGLLKRWMKLLKIIKIFFVY